ncbi:SRPBCC family protein [candidate division KSB1 bacterium]|nr:SRPBCC family protein [candidate division KSB1 bacterium]
MTRTTIIRLIDAPLDKVFKTVSDISQFSQAIPHIIKIEYLSDKKNGVGTRFRETRLMKGKEAVTELEVTEYIENERVRFVADSHGTVWDTVFTVKAKDMQTELTMTMDAKAYQLLPKLINPTSTPCFRTRFKWSISCTASQTDRRGASTPPSFPQRRDRFI